MAQLVCEECGKIIDATDNRCSYCGCPIEVMSSYSKIHTKNTSAKFCKDCGKILDESASYCPHCGCQQNNNQEKKNETDVMSILGFSVALISLFLNFGGIVGIAATVLSILSITRCQKTGAKGQGLAIAGAVIGGFSIIYGSFVLILL